MATELVDSLRSVDLFHKNCFLLFEDIVSTIKENTYADNVTEFRWPEGMYQISNSKDSEYRRQYIFKHNDTIRFICLFVKLSESGMQKDCAYYKQICKEALVVDPVYPLLVVYGVLKPRDLERFEKEHDLRRNWIDNTLLLELPDHIRQVTEIPIPYCFERELEIKTAYETDSWYCEHAVFKIKKLLDVKDSERVKLIVKDLLTMQ